MTLPSRLSEGAFPVVLEPSGAPVLALGGVGAHPVMIVSVPRTGTHFAAELLSHLGLLNAGLHLSPGIEADRAQDRRFLVPTLSGPDWLTHSIRFGDVMRLLRNGQFVQGHVPYDGPKRSAELGPAKVVYLRRSIRNALVSSMRFVEKLSGGQPIAGDPDTAWFGAPAGPEKLLAYLKTYGAGYPEMINAISPWRSLPQTFVLNFDLIVNGERMSDAVDHAVLLAEHVGAEVGRAQVEQAIRNATGSDTASWTGRLSRYQEFWSDAVEAKFEQMGLAALDV